MKKLKKKFIENMVHVFFKISKNEKFKKIQSIKSTNSINQPIKTSLPSMSRKSNRAKEKIDYTENEEEGNDKNTQGEDGKGEIIPLKKRKEENKEQDEGKKTPKKRGRPRKNKEVLPSQMEFDSEEADLMFEETGSRMTERQQIMLLQKSKEVNYKDASEEDESFDEKQISEEDIEEKKKPKKKVTMKVTEKITIPKKQIETYKLILNSRGDPLGTITITPKTTLDANIMKGLNQSYNIDKLFSIEKLLKVKVDFLQRFICESNEKLKRMYQILERDNMAGVIFLPGIMIFFIPQTENIIKYFGFEEKDKLLGAILYLEENEKKLFIEQKKQKDLEFEMKRKQQLEQQQEKNPQEIFSYLTQFNLSPDQVENMLKTIAKKEEKKEVLPPQFIEYQSYNPPPMMIPIQQSQFPIIQQQPQIIQQHIPMNIYSQRETIPYKKEEYKPPPPPSMMEDPYMKSRNILDDPYLKSKPLPPPREEYIKSPIEEYKMKPLPPPPREEYIKPPPPPPDNFHENQYSRFDIPPRPKYIPQNRRRSLSPQRSPTSRSPSPPRKSDFYQKSYERREREPTRHLWVGRFYSGNIDKSELRRDFEIFGQIESINVLKDQKCAFINFIKVEDAIKCKNTLQGTNNYPKIEFQQPKQQPKQFQK